jgi:hypothetical protein
MVYFLQDWIVNPMLNLLKRTMTYSGVESGTFRCRADILPPILLIGANVVRVVLMVKNLGFVLNERLTMYHF